MNVIMWIVQLWTVVKLVQTANIGSWWKTGSTVAFHRSQWTGHNLQIRCTLCIQLSAISMKRLIHVNTIVFSSSELRSLWMDIQKEYEKVFINFKKSGNHNSSFTKEAMLLYKRENQEDDCIDDESMSSFDKDDIFGVEEGGFCCFTNSVVIIYLRLWLNERPVLTRFVNHQLPAEIQVNSMSVPANSVQSKLQSKSSNVSDT